MKIVCPHCNHRVELALAYTDTVTNCPSCQSRLEIVGDTQSYTMPPAVLQEGFDLLEHLGTGQFGSVWKARDRKLDRIVAIKMPRMLDMDPLTIAAFVREAQAAAQLRHPNIVSVHDIVMAGHKIFIVGEYVNGVSLAHYLESKRMSFQEAAATCATVADALQHAHDARVVHRDLKPANILLDDNGSPHLTDFGLAKREGDAITMTVEGELLGTPAYMSPEQAEGKGHDADGRSDVYSLGVILYELLIGQRPFKGGSRMLIQQVLHEEPPSPRRINGLVPRDLETICLRALQKRADQRYATAREMAEDLRRWLRAEPIVARPIGPVERTIRWCKRKPASASAVAIAVAALVVIGVVMGASYRKNQLADAAQSKLGSQLDSEKARASRAERERQQMEQFAPRPMRVSIATQPSGANVVFYPIDAQSGWVLFDRGVTATMDGSAIAEVVPGQYLVVAWLPSGDFHEVFRYVPVRSSERPMTQYKHRHFEVTGDADVTLDVIDILPTEQVIANMAKVSGAGQFRFGEKTTVTLPDFYLDTTEVTSNSFREHWTGLRPPAGSNPGNYPMTNVNLDDAIAYAENVGKVVANEVWLEYAATQYGKSRFPWGNDVEHPPSWKLSPVGVTPFDQLNTVPPIHGLMTNALEWATSCPTLVMLGTGQPVISDFAAVRGGPTEALKPEALPQSWNDVTGKTRFNLPWMTTHPLVGFRCGRSVHARVTQDDFVREISGSDTTKSTALK